MINERQECLLEYLKEHSGEWVTRQKIAQDLPHLYPAESYEFSRFRDCRARRLIDKDLNALTDCGSVHEVIVSGRCGVKIATREEYSKYLRTEIHAAVRRLQKARKISAKGNLDGQMIFTTTDEQEIIRAFL